MVGKINAWKGLMTRQYAPTDEACGDEDGPLVQSRASLFERLDPEL